MDISYENKIEEYNLGSNYLSKDYVKIDINKKFMLYQDDHILKIYDFELKSFLAESLSLHNNISYFHFHCNFETIFFICDDNSIIIYEIDNKKIIKLSKIKGIAKVNFACFNPFNSNLLLSYSNNGNILIYNITEGLPIAHILLEKIEIEQIKWNKNIIAYKYYNDNNVSYFEYANFKKENIKKYKNTNIIDFYLYDIDDDSLIVITNNNVEIIKNNIKIIEHKFELMTKDIFAFYFTKKKILTIIFRDKIQGLYINKDYRIISSFIFQQSYLYYINKPIFINENLLTQNEICCLYQTSFSDIIIYSIRDKNNQNNNIINNNDSFNVKSIKKYISDIPILISSNNNWIENNFIRNKNYFEIDSIKNELIEIKKVSLLKRKNKVDKDLKVIEEIKDIKEKYISLLKLLINDNTNKNLLIKYLKFLEKNENYLRILYKNNFEEYKNERDYYSKVFTAEEYKKHFNSTKVSQKNELITLLERILGYNGDKQDDLKKFENFLKECEKYFENIIYFNMPIDFSNQELMYYKNINLLKDYFKNKYEKTRENYYNNDNDNKLIKENINPILSNFQNKLKLCINDLRTLTDLHKINILINLLTSIEDDKEFTGCYKYISSGTGDINIIKNLNDSYINEYLNEFEKIDINLNLFKQFYKNVLPLKSFKTIYLTLYGKDAYYPFDDKEFTNNFVDNSFEVLNACIRESLGLTEKLTMKTYLNPFVRKMIGIYKDKEKMILQYGSLIGTGNHEIGNNLVNIQFFMENCKIPLETSRKKSFGLSEGGNYVELALLGKLLKEINLEESLYILNEKNYEKSFMDFQEGFNNIQRSDLIVEGVFKNICKGITFDENFKKISSTAYTISKHLNSEKIKMIRIIRNDVIGKK